MKVHFSLIRSLALGAAVIAVAVLGATGATAAPQSTTLNIGILDSLTGLSASACLEELNGMKLALAEAGHRKEVVDGKRVPYLHGFSVKLDQQDDQSTAAGAVTGFRAIADSSDVAMVGPCSSVVATAIDPSLDSTKIPAVFSTAGADGIVDPAYAFRGGSPMSFFSGRAVQVMKGMGIKTVYALWNSDNPVYTDIFTAMKATMKVLGIDLVGSFSTTASTVDYSPAIQQIQQLKPDAIAVLVRSSSVPAAMTQLRNAGLKGPFFGSGNWSAEQFAGPMMTGGYYATNFADVFPYKSSMLFTKEFKTKYDKDPNAQDANGYDAMWRVLRAIHDTDQAKLAKASTAEARTLLQQTLAAQKSASLAQGPLTFTSTGDVKANAGVVQITDDSGDLKLIPTPSVASLLKK